MQIDEKEGKFLITTDSEDSSQTIKYVSWYHTEGDLYQGIVIKSKNKTKAELLALAECIEENYRIGFN